ncbi:MAG: glycosyltransferase family 4 protein, partial [Alphaproteobacteria bacterium]|nr:glycosyltransferase family 4 protein [Alphaproteobacteria bacterium]
LHCKQESRNIKKFFFQIIIAIISPIVRLLARIIKRPNFQNYDAFLSPALFIDKSIKPRHYTILHDLIPLIFPKYSSDKWSKGFWPYDVCQSLSTNDYYFANSENTRYDFLKNFPQKIDPEKIFAVYLGCDEKFKPCNKNINAVKKKYHIPNNKKYVFTLCTLDPRKNLQRIITTFVQFLEKNSIDDMFFVLGGGHWNQFLPEIKDTIKKLGKYKDNIIQVGYIDDEDLPTLYTGAEWFVFTSMYEGFGLPLLEAMSCGCPIIASNNSSLPEVVGDAGIMIDWNSDDQHIAAYEQYYFSPELRKQNSEKGLARAKDFSWEKSVNQIVNMIKTTCK